MRWKKEAVFVMLACENQEEVHYAMPVRNMVYDSLSYTEQIQRLWKKRVEETKTKSNKKLTSAEFLSKFTKKDRLIPVITLVFYYGIEPWDASTDLYGMFQWGEEERTSQILKKYISNYSINLIDANKIDNLKRFQTDLQEILGVLQCRGDKERLLEYINERADYFQNVDEETYHFMRVALHSGKLLKENIERSEGEDGVNMCKALEDLYNDGIECGIEQGEIKGMVKICRSFEMEKEDAMQRIMDELKISREKAEEGVERYWE
ncbi:MAG: Rpn family recombination-promoting nuclease/putative transposase, partial [Lachnospiraceae bacterium]